MGAKQNFGAVASTAEAGMPGPFHFTGAEGAGFRSQFFSTENPV
jgi:hypothetical protein